MREGRAHGAGLRHFRVVSSELKAATTAVLIVGGVLASFVSPPPAYAADRNGNGAIVVEGAPVKRIVVTLNKSRIFNVETPFSRAIVAGPEIADVLPLSDRRVYVQGKKPGTTNVSMIAADGQVIAVLDLEVTLDTGTLQERIRSSTGSQGIRVSSRQNQVVLSGVAADSVAAERAMRVAKSMGGDAEVVNALTVAPSQQVMLEVRFLEVSREAGRELGVNLYGANKSGTGGVRTGLGVVGRNAVAPNTPSGIPIFETAGTLVGAGVGGPFGTVLGRLLSTNNFNVDVLVTALEEKHLIRRLAEPNLVALSGDTARFLAGGEYPIPVPAALGTAPTIEYKRFGVELSFTPTVLSRGVINLRIAPSVSEIAEFVGNPPNPVLTKRDALTTVELRDGQSFAMAGLLTSQNSRDISQLPWIGSVPVLGALFRSSAFQQRETDLVVIVTPRLIAPVVPGQRLASPLDSRLPSNDVDFFINGQPEVQKRYEDYVTAGGDLKGPYGHIVEPELGPSKPVKRR